MSIAGENNKFPEHIEEMVKLAFGAEGPDVVREVFREEIRAGIDQAVRDNVLGAAEVMTQMLPRALKSLEDDLDSGDWVVRSRAQALLLKYAMSFADKQGEQKDLGKLTVALQAPVPEAQTHSEPKHMSEKIIELRAENDGLEIEDYEQEWPICNHCNQRKHPEAMYTYSDGANRNPRTICKSCEVRRKLEAGKAIDHNAFDRKLYG